MYKDTISIFTDKTVNYLMDVARLNLAVPDEEAFRLVEGLAMLIEIPNPDNGKIHDQLNFDRDYARCLNFYFEDVDVWQSNENFNEIEAFLKKLFRVISPDVWEKEWKEYETGQTSYEPFKLYDLYWHLHLLQRMKDGGVDPQIYKITEANLYRYECLRHNLYSYAVNYVARNDDCHGINKDTKDHFFISYLDMIRRHYDKVEEAYKKLIKS